MKKSITFTFFGLLVLIAIILVLFFRLNNVSLSLSPNSENIVCANGEPDSACGIYSHVLMNGDLHGVELIPGLINRMLHCFVEERGFPNPRVHGVSDEDIGDLLECKEQIMLEEYDIIEDLVYIPLDFENPFTGNTIQQSGGSIIDCVVGRIVVLKISNSVPGTSGTTARFRHMIKCKIEECQESKTVLLCEDYLAQGGGQFSMTISPSGGINTRPNTLYNGGVLNGVTYVR